MTKNLLSVSAVGVGLLGLGITSSALRAHQSTSALPPPVQLTSQEDHDRQMKDLHLASLPAAVSADQGDLYDEATANPFPTLPDPLVMKNGKKVTSPGMWKARRAEILEDFEREVYGRRPKVTPKVTWQITNTTNGTNGDVPTVTKQLVGHVDNSSYPLITVNIQATLTTPEC